MPKLQELRGLSIPLDLALLVILAPSLKLESLPYQRCKIQVITLAPIGDSILPVRCQEPIRLVSFPVWRLD